MERVNWHLDEFERIRTSEGMHEYLNEIGTRLVSELNAELHEAQAARSQPIADGYKFYITKGTRARLHIVAFTARAQAHEAKHQSILRKLGEAEVATADARMTPAQRAARDRRREDAHQRRADREIDEWIRQREHEEDQ
ncbi:MAG: hypothetical protein ACRDTI_07920 [Mycobacterium sp.]